jgi:hypothetical protein
MAAALGIRSRSNPLHAIWRTIPAVDRIPISPMMARERMDGRVVAVVRETYTKAAIADSRAAQTPYLLRQSR